MNCKHELDLATLAATTAGKYLVAEFENETVVRSSIGKDIKTQADLNAEEVIISKLSATTYPILAEESGGVVSKNSLHWLVDPLDGTMNFSRGFPMFAISIGLWNGLDPVLGVVLDVTRNDLYSGIDSVGAWKNGEPISVSETTKIGQSILATGFPVNRDFEDESILQFITRVQTFKKIRMIGSAALSLCMVACGKFDAYFEEDIMLWDVAGGAAIVNAAGGQCKIGTGNLENSVNLTAWNGNLELEVMERLTS